MFPKKRKHSQILLKSQESAQGCWKCKNSSPNSKKCWKIAQHNQDMPIHWVVRKIEGKADQTALDGLFICPIFRLDKSSLHQGQELKGKWE